MCYVLMFFITKKRPKMKKNVKTRTKNAKKRFTSMQQTHAGSEKQNRTNVCRDWE